MIKTGRLDSGDAVACKGVTESTAKEEEKLPEIGEFKKESKDGQRQ